MNLESGHLGFKPNLAAKGYDRPAQVFYGGSQTVGANVRLRLKENFLRRSGCGKLFQNLSGPSVLGSGVQLAVGEGTRATLAELYVGEGIQLSC